MAIQVYRSWETVQGANYPECYYSEICRDCAIQENSEGREIQFDGYLSNIDPLSKDEECEKCGCTFYVDGRKHHYNEQLECSK
jgi:hypothetical protein